MAQRIRVLAVAQGVDPDLRLANFALRPSFLGGMLDALEVEWGGVDRYLATVGLTPRTLEQFRQNFVRAD